jgi:hypothetical protein
MSALEGALAYPDAVAYQDHAALRARSFLCRYLYAFNAAMSGRLELTRAVAAELLPDSAETTGLRDTIRGICERADRVAGVCPLDGRDLRGWHYVLTGGLVSHQSPYGFDEPMHGRYAWLADSLARVATGLDRLAQLVAPLGCRASTRHPAAITRSSHSRRAAASGSRSRRGRRSASRRRG